MGSGRSVVSMGGDNKPTSNNQKTANVSVFPVSILKTSASNGSGKGGFDLERQSTFASTYKTDPTPLMHLKHKSGGCTCKWSWVFLGFVGVVGTVFLLQMIVTLAMFTQPALKALHSFNQVADIVTANEGVFEAATAFLAPEASTAASSSSAVAMEASGVNANVEETEFIQWCRSAPCLSDKVSMCDDLDEDLASARSPEGAPIVPMPKTFCNAVEVLSSNRCLCDANLANSTITGESANIVGFAGMIGKLCQIDNIIAPSTDPTC